MIEPRIAEQTTNFFITITLKLIKPLETDQFNETIPFDSSSAKSSICRTDSNMEIVDCKSNKETHKIKHH